MAFLNEAEHAQVSAAVAAAEANSAGEIVTVLAEQSDGYSDIQLAWSVLAGTSALAVLAVFSDFYLAKVDVLLGGWNHEWTPATLLSLALFLVIAKFVGVWLIQLWRPLKFFLVPAPIKRTRVREAAVRHFKVGAERRTPKSGPLPGLNRESFWRYSFAAPSDDDLEQFLGLVVAQLEAASAFFKGLIASGGYARLFVGLFLEQENIGIEISSELQRRCSQLGISLGFDIYGPDQPDGAA